MNGKIKRGVFCCEFLPACFLVCVYCFFFPGINTFQYNAIFSLFIFSTYKVCEYQLFFFRLRNSRFLSGFNTFQHIRHISPECSHRLQAF